MNKYLNKIAYYFKDSYGFDKLSKYLFIAGILLSATRYTAIFGFAIVIYATWRCVSKNKYKRYQELSLFENKLQILKQKFYKTKYSFNESRQYKIFTCPSCSQKLRIPKKQGKVVITCKKCGNQFKAKS